MKIAALLAGIGLCLNVLVDFVNFALNVPRMGAYFAPRYLIGQGTWLFAQACLIAFLFSFYTRVKE